MKVKVNDDPSTLYDALLMCVSLKSLDDHVSDVRVPTSPLKKLLMTKYDLF